MSDHALAQTQKVATPTFTPVHSGLLQRKCACGNHTTGNAECDSCRGGRSGMLQRAAKDSTAVNAVPPIVHEVLRSPGQPLDATTRAFFEPSFAHDFSQVRVHTDAKAAESARAVNATAYTVGHDVVFDTGRFAPGHAQGRKLLAHELAHVVQQRNETSLSRFAVSLQHSAAEQEADAAAARVVAGQPAGGLNVASSPRIQREAAPGKPTPQLSRWQSFAIDTATAGVAVGNPTLGRLLAATLRGLVLEAEAQMQAKAGDRFLERVKELLKSPSQLLEFYGNYLLGLVKGIFSPITGLFDLAKLGFQLTAMQAHILQAAWTQREALAKDAGEIGQNFSALGGKAKKAVGAFFDNPKETIRALSKWLDAQGDKVAQRAEAAGHSIGQAIFSSLEKPWSVIGETVGEVIGTVLVNLALFIFTEGIGNAIVQIASKLGELGSALSKMGKGARLLGTVIEEVSGLLSKAGVLIAELEKGLASVAETLLKPLKPVMEEFGRLLGSLRSFLRRLLGVSDEAATAATERLAAGAGKALEPHAPAPPPQAPKLTTPAPKTTPKPIEKPPVLEGHSPKLEPSAPPPTLKEVPPPIPQKPGVLHDVSDDAARALEKNPALLEAYEKNPHAAAAMKFCQSPCVLPEFATPQQVQRVEKLMTEAESRGIELNRKKLAEYLNHPANEAELGQAIDELEQAFRKSGSMSQPVGETVPDESELLQQLGMKHRKPVDVRLAEAAEGRRFDVRGSRMYPKNQIPIRDKSGGQPNWLDSYDPVRGEIISRKSLAGTQGQIAFTDEFKMIEHFQEFPLKYPNGHAIADVPSSAKMGFAPDPAGNMPEVVGKYVLEVPVQRYPIPERIRQEAINRGIIIRDIKGTVY